MTNIKKKYKCIIWGCGTDYDKHINEIKYVEIKQQIEVVGITANEDIYTRIDGYDFVDRKKLKDIDFDIIIVASINKFNEIRKEILGFGFDEDKIISITIFSIPNMDFDAYMKIKESGLSILAINCWGGITYHRLGMRLNSPFINMYESCEDFLKIIESPKEYIETPLEKKGYGINRITKEKFPVCSLNSALLNCLHYKSHEEVLELWEKRKRRINWDNLFIMMYADNKGQAAKFVDLPYEKKVCFVPFETNEESLCYIDFANGEMAKKNMLFQHVVINIATGAYKYYDVIDLLSGKVNRNRLIYPKV